MTHPGIKTKHKEISKTIWNLLNKLKAENRMILQNHSKTCLILRTFSEIRESWSFWLIHIVKNTDQIVESKFEIFISLPSHIPIYDWTWSRCKGGYLSLQMPFWVAINHTFGNLRSFTKSCTDGKISLGCYCARCR